MYIVQYPSDVQGVTQYCMQWKLEYINPQLILDLGSGLNIHDSVDLPIFQRQVVKTLDSECECFSALVY